MAEYMQADRPLSVTTPLGPNALLLTGVDGREGMSELFHYRVHLLAENDAKGCRSTNCWGRRSA